MKTLITFQEIVNLYDNVKSAPVVKAVEFLQAKGVQVKYKKFKSYKDIKTAGHRYVTSRVEKSYWEVKVDGHVFNSEISMHTAFALTAYIVRTFSK